MGFYDVILSILLSFCFVPAVVGIIRYRFLTQGLRLLLYYFVLVFLVEAHGLYQTINGNNSVWVYHFYCPLEYLLVLTALSTWIRNISFKKWLRWSIAGFVLISVASSISTGSLQKFDYFPVTVAYVIFTGVSAFILFQLLSSDREEILNNPLTWIAFGFIVMPACNLIWYAFQGFIPLGFRRLLWAAHNFVNMAAYLMFAIGFYLSKYSIREGEIEDTSRTFISISRQQ